MNWPRLKRLGWALVIFSMGITIGGDWPKWATIFVPACIVLWLILFDDLSDERALWKRQREYYANYEDCEEGE